jgi:putative redox protein
LTLQLYIKRKGWAVERISVAVAHSKSAAGYQLERTVRFTGPLNGEQQAALRRIAEACPVHKTLSGPITIVTRTEAIG